MFSSTRRLAVTLVLGLAAVLVTVFTVTLIARAVSGDHNRSAAVATPAVYGPTVGGQLYCGYRFIPDECFGNPGIPMLLPTVAPIYDASDYAVQLETYRHYLRYERAYDGSWGYDRYERNARRTGQTVVIAKKVYVANGDTWYKNHKADVDKLAKDAPYVTKDANGKPVTVKGDKYANQANKASDLTKVKDPKAKTGGGNAGTVADPAKKTPAKVTTEKNSTSKTSTSGSSTRSTSGGSAPRSTSGGSSGLSRK